jgi:peptide/nickel transport system permease protein
MGNYLVKRSLALFPVLLGLSIIVFLIMRALPGDVAMIILSGGGEQGSAGSKEALDNLRVQLGLNQPLYVQYFGWIGGLLKFDAGNSLWSGRPVFEEIGQRLPLTLELSLLSLAISMLIALPLGIVSAARQNSFVDYLFRIISVSGLAVPTFWAGTLVILFLSISFNWAPPLGYVDFFNDPVRNVQQLIWPAVILGYANASVLSRMIRSSMLEVLREDYVRTASAKGLAPRHILVVHVLRNSLLPVLTIAAIELGHLLGGTVVMETIFTLPGIGRFLIDSIFHRDYPVVQTIVLMMGVAYVVLNLAVDILYGILDPRIRYS